MDNTRIINADDFGKNSLVNLAILRCFEKNWIQSASIMANMPGFTEACQMAHDYNLIDRIGVHVTLSMGRPLTEEILKEKRFCDQNGFIHPRPHKKRFFILTRSESVALSSEISAQIEKCRKNGLRLTHLDSHHHFHEEWAVMSILIPLIRQYQIPRVRIMSNMRELTTIRRKLYTSIFNARLELLDIGRSKFFGTVYDFSELTKQYLSKKRKSSFELMVHPTLDDDKNVIDDEKGELFGDLLGKTKILF
jgi:chitin disaccharide deacetylase